MGLKKRQFRVLGLPENNKMPKSKSKIPKSKWTNDEREFDRLVDGMSSPNQLTRINARIDWKRFEARFTKEQLDAMWERIK